MFSPPLTQPAKRINNNKQPIPFPRYRTNVRKFENQQLHFITILLLTLHAPAACQPNLVAKRLHNTIDVTSQNYISEHASAVLPMFPRVEHNRERENCGISVLASVPARGEPSVSFRHLKPRSLLDPVTD